MGCWALPFQDVKTAKKFKQKMNCPWVAKVKWDKNNEYYSWEAKGLHGLLGDDSLYDEFHDKASKGLDFDIRPSIKKLLKRWLLEYEESLWNPNDPIAINIVRESIGLKPASQFANLKPHQRLPKKILELVENENLLVRNCRLKKGELKTYPFNRITKSPSSTYYVFEVAFKNNVNLNKLKKILKDLPLKKIVKEFGTLVYFQFDSKKSKDIVPLCEKKEFYLEYKKGTSNKFWQARVTARKTIVQFGKINTPGRKSEKLFKSSQQALEYIHQMVKAKIKKGYIEASPN